ncbi:MAG TPA: trypsin-like peptidase domain-containing protein [Acidimicrobiales bacterium]|nr:trypsin-like peptidase domain-containing protein [Acidimicrobiales bacterium]
MDSMTDHDAPTFEWLPPSPPPPSGPPPDPARAGTPGRRTVLVVAVVAAVVGAGVGAGVSQAFGGGSGQTVVENFSPNSSVVNERPADIQGILAKVLPSVVTIAAFSTSSSGASPFPFGGGGGAVQQESQGTGMIITPGGEVVTNNHVVSGASRITVTIHGSTRALTATVVGADPSDDVALLQIQGASGNLPTVSFGRSAQVKVGDGVVAIGNALGLHGGPTVTAGIISAEDRGLTAQDPSTQQQITLTNMLQTDAAINPGNSGGPLVNSSGQVIGMNSDEATNAGDATAQNIGFAIPSDKITSLLPLLRKGGTVSPARAYMGVEGGDVTPQVQAEFNLVPSQGAFVQQVVSGTPAQSGGIQAGDVIVSLDGNPVNSWDDLTIALRSHKPGDKITLGVYRGSRQLTVSVTLGTAPTTTQ